MSKETRNEDGMIEFKKSMTADVETRSMSKNNEENPEDYINFLTKMKNEDKNEK